MHQDEPTTELDNLARLDTNPSDRAIAQHFRFNVQSLVQHLSVSRIRKLAIIELMEVRPDLSRMTAGYLLDRCFADRYGSFQSFCQMPPDQRRTLPW